MSKHIIKIKDGKIIEDPNHFIDAIKAGDGYYSVGISKPKDQVIAPVRAAFFAGPVKHWQKKGNESGYFQVNGQVLWFDNWMTYNFLKALYGRKNEETGKPESIADSGKYNRDDMLDLLQAAIDGYYETFGEVMPDRKLDNIMNMFDGEEV